MDGIVFKNYKKYQSFLRIYMILERISLEFYGTKWYYDKRSIMQKWHPIPIAE